MSPHIRRAWLVGAAVVGLVAEQSARGQAGPGAQTAAAAAFPLVRSSAVGGVSGLREAASLWVDPGDWPGVMRAAGDLQQDVRRVTGVMPLLTRATAPAGALVVIVGTIGRSALIDRLVRDRKIDVADITGAWESFVTQTVNDPMPGVRQALVVAGSDKRGTIYGIYDLSEQIGVSPWYWWADVTPAHQDTLSIRSARTRQGEPSVKYRGIFFNDERPDLDYWVRAKLGEHPTPGGQPGTIANFNSQFYAKVFELLLRLKANYLWPAMWNNAFAEDDPDNARLADEYGIVMGTSHQEPMLRAQKEWDWHLRPTLGLWNYATHAAEMQTFWREGVRARKNFEAVYTIGLRGENDTAMVQGAAENMALLDRIVAAQRQILAEEVNPDVTKIPQLWCLYKEVQGYYESGLRVPDDVTLLWAEDNWGNLRRVPTADERKRPGGAGIYYHFDYHGGPRSYQWINTSPIPKIWEQMSLAKAYGADRIWIVNVGHLKGYELPTEFFLKYAWDTSRWTADNLGAFTRDWAQREFGRQASAIADVVSAYTKYNGRRKPELLEPGTYSLVHFNEAESMLADWQALVTRAASLMAAMPADKKDAFYQLVQFPVVASAQVNELYVAAGKNALYASQGRASTNAWAARVRELFQADADLMTYFNKTFAGGKWDHFMDQSHIGYTTWADPPANTLAAIRLVDRTPPATAGLGVAIEGSGSAWPGAAGDPALPGFDALNQQRRWIDVFNRGAAPFDFTASPSVPWIVVGQPRGRIGDDTRLWVTIDWARAPAGVARGSVTIAGAGERVVIGVEARRPADVTRETLAGFAENAGFVAMEAEHFSAKADTGGWRWVRVPDYGRTLSGLRLEPLAPGGWTTAPAAQGGGSDEKVYLEAPRLEYRMYLFNAGPLTAEITLAPSLNIEPGRAVTIAVAIDDEAPQRLTVVPAGYSAQNGNQDWERSVRDNARVVTSMHAVATSGYHTLKMWSGTVITKIVVTTAAAGDAKSYLGPPETFRGIARPPVGR